MWPSWWELVWPCYRWVGQWRRHQRWTWGIWLLRTHVRKHLQTRVPRSPGVCAYVLLSIVERAFQTRDVIETSMIDTLWLCPGVVIRPTRVPVSMHPGKRVFPRVTLAKTNRVGRKISTWLVVLGALLLVVAAPECGRADLKVSSNKSKHCLSSPYLFPVLSTQCKQNTKIIIYRPLQRVRPSVIVKLKNDGTQHSAILFWIARLNFSRVSQ